ncbi:MAG TPA: hypothetical protein PKU93_01630 [Candidatus Pacearchaeota archaeon]|nr:hypothetical protein [Candidatus Pacearchaeota archaeon]
MGIFNTIIDKYKTAKQKSLNKKEFREILLRAVDDGKLSKDEIDELDKKKTEFGLTDEDVKSIRAEIFVAAFSVAKDDKQVTEEEEKELKEIQKYLGLADDEIQTSKKELARLRLLNEIQKGNLPTVPVTNLVTQKGETAYWAEPAILAEEKVIRRRYEGGSQGVSFRVMKGVSYRVGGHRGHIVSETGLVPVSDGELIVTNKRIIFRGDGKAFAIKLDKILDIQIFTNGLQFSENNKPKPRMVKFKQEGKHDIVGAVLSYSINHYGDKE